MHQESFARTSLEVQGLRLLLPMQRVQFQSLVRELGSYMPCGQRTKTFKKRKKKEKQYYNKFNKDILNGPYQEDLKKKKKTVGKIIREGTEMHFNRQGFSQWLFATSKITPVTIIFEAVFGCLKNNNMDIFSRINSIVFFRPTTVFLFFFLQRHSNVCCVGSLAMKGSLSHRGWVPILIQCKGNSNIARYFHISIVSAVVLHHCKLSSV